MAPNKFPGAHQALLIRATAGHSQSCKPQRSAGHLKLVEPSPRNGNVTTCLAGRDPRLF